jgi:hypothetical protein
MALDIEGIIEEFLAEVKKGSVEIYNEFSLQHELGIFLRKKFKKDGNNYKVQFERNARELFEDWENSVSEKISDKKWEIDIIIYSGNILQPTELVAAIELKFPRNGQIPEQMYSFCKDIAFVEQLSDKKKKRFDNAYVLVLVDDEKFYKETNRENTSIIYTYFRNREELSGNINKPTGKYKDEKSVTIKGKYTFNWKENGTIQKKFFYDEEGKIKSIDTVEQATLMYELIKAKVK